MNLSYQFDVTSIRSELIPIRSPLFGLVLGGLLLMSGCASTQSYRTSCPVAPETVTATQSQAEAGGAASQYQIGLWYQANICLKQDKAIATEWFRRAAEQGHADAQYSLGRIYVYRDETEQDDEEAARWFRQAAEQGHPRASWWLGDLYVAGSGVARDFDRAEYWYRRAFAGKALSRTELDQRLDHLEKIRGLPAWKRKQQRLADEGDREAQYELGILYSGGRDYVEQNLAQAFKWFQKSADQGHANAQFALGRMYEQGIGGISKDVENAKDLYQKAADQEHMLAKRRLCDLSEDCTPAPKSTGKYASGGSEYWILLCLIPYVQLACVLGGGM